MIATEARVDSIDLLEAVGEPRGRQVMRSQPPAEIEERSRDRRKGDADQRESCQHRSGAEARSPGLCRRFTFVHRDPDGSWDVDCRLLHESNSRKEVSPLPLLRHWLNMTQPSDVDEGKATTVPRRLGAALLPALWL